MFSVTLGGCSLANEALGARADESIQGDAGRYTTLARFFAENIASAGPGLEEAVTSGADSTLMLEPEALSA